ncbi:MAG: hypothetical protein V9G09_02470 [Candidatus Nanopelagicales bacterium]
MLAATEPGEYNEVDSFCYSAYGFTLMSAFPLPELLAGEGKADISIEIGRCRGIASHDYSPILCASASPNQVHLTWGKVGDLLIEDGRRIIVLPHPDTDEDALRLFILGAGLGVLLHQRGLLVLHASGVVIHDRVVGFIGAKGCGKSTTAAILHQRGHALVSDELLVVDFDSQDRPLIMPGPSQIRLWSDALVYTGRDPDSTARVRSGIDKFNVNALIVAPKALPLGSLYLLDAEGAFCIEPVFSGDRFLSIIPHLYVSRFGTPFFQSTNPAYSFKQLNLLLKQVNVKRLFRRRDLSQSLSIARLIEQDSF